MATKSKLEQAVRKHADSLNDAQRELVMSQFAVYKRNDERLAIVESELNAVNARRATTREGVRIKQAQRMSMTSEINQLVTANSRIAADLFEFLKERP